MYKISVNSREISLLDKVGIKYNILNRLANNTILIEAADNIVEKLNKSYISDIKSTLYDWAADIYKVYGVSGEQLGEELVNTLQKLSKKFDTEFSDKVYKLIPSIVEKVTDKFVYREVPKEDVLEKAITTEAPFVQKTVAPKEDWETFKMKYKDMLSPSPINALLAINALEEKDVTFLVNTINDLSKDVFSSLETLNRTIMDAFTEYREDADILARSITPRVHSLEQFVSNMLASMRTYTEAMESNREIKEEPKAEE